MDAQLETMETVFQNCDVLLDGEVISRELILRTYGNFLNETYKQETHSVGIALHTGSPLFDAIAIAFAALSNLMLNTTSSADIISSLKKGDTVLYGKTAKSRYIFDGFLEKKIASDEDYILLRDDKKSKTYVPKSMWRLIAPYLGQSKSLDRKGIRKTSGIRDDFFHEVLGIDKLEIPSVIDTSTVIAMTRESANWLINGISFKFNGKTARLLELVTASFFTESEEYRYGGNAAKNEPILKLCGNLSVAREKLLDLSGNKNAGLIVLGNDILARGYSEMPFLMKKKATRYVVVSTQIDSECGRQLLNEVEDAEIFACTKDFLLSHSLKPATECRMTYELYDQIDAIIERRCEPVYISSHYGWKEYRQFKQNIMMIKESGLASQEKDSFIIQAYSLMKLFSTSVFTMRAMEALIKEGVISAALPSERLDELKSSAADFPPFLKDAASSVLDFLETMYLLLDEKSPKEEYLRGYLNEHSDRNIAVVVPKAYYEDVIRSIGLYSLMKEPGRLTVTTANRFDNTTVFDDVICAGDFEGRRFNPFRCRSAYNIYTLLLDFEANLFRHKLRADREAERRINSKSTIAFVEDKPFDDLSYEDASEEDVLATEKIDAEIDSYIAFLNESAEFKHFGVSAGASSSTKIVAIGTFENGQKAFFTPMYKAYVYDELSGEATEKSVDDLCEGDSIVFTRSTDETRDIVDEILGKLVGERKLSGEILESYAMSKRWKEELISYMKEKHLSTASVAKEMKRNGVGVQEITIRSWLDEDSHIVGPRSAESIRQVAFLVNDGEMFEQYDRYFEGCKTVRSVRRKILKMIGESIIQSISGKVPEKGSLLADVSEKIASLGLILRLESILHVNREVPTGVVNKPISVKE